MSNVLEISCWSDDGCTYEKFPVTITFGPYRWSTVIMRTYFDEIMFPRITSPRRIDTTEWKDYKDYLVKYGETLLQTMLTNAPQSLQWNTLTKIVVQGTTRLLALHWEAMADPIDRKLMVAESREIVRVPIQPSEPMIPLRGDTTVIRVLVVIFRTTTPKMDLDKEPVLQTLFRLEKRAELRMTVDVLSPATWLKLTTHLIEKGAGYYHALLYDGRATNLILEQIKYYASLTTADYNIIPGTLATPVGARDFNCFRHDSNMNCVLFEWPDGSKRIDAVHATDFAKTVHSAQIPVVLMVGDGPAKSAIRNGVQEQSVLDYLADFGVNAAVGCSHDMNLTAETIWANTLLECVFAQRMTVSAAALAARRALSNFPERSETGNVMNTWLLPQVVQRTTGDVLLKPRDMTMHEEREWMNAHSKRFAPTAATPVARPTVKEMMLREAKFIPTEDLTRILAGVCSLSNLEMLGRALPTRDGSTRETHLISRNMAATDVVMLWINDCKTDATIEVLLGVLKTLFNSSYEELLNWVQKNSQLDN